MSSHSIRATRVNHDGPTYPSKVLIGDVALALGYAPQANDKVYLTVEQFASYGIVQRPKTEPKVTVREVLAAISQIGLEPHRLDAAGQPVYDPIPIRLALSPDDAEVVWYDDDHVYVNIARVIRARIKTGKLGKLPSNAALAIEFGVMRRTIRNALRVLHDEGLIYAIPSHGTFVSKK